MNSYASAPLKIAHNVVEFDHTNPSFSTTPPNDEKWAGWQTVLFIMATCGTFWTAIFLALKNILS